MSETFQLFRLVLTPRKQLDLLNLHDDITRRQYLESVFSEERQFNYRKTVFHYRPENRTSSGELITGRIGRLLRREENLPPEQDFKETTHDSWKAIVVVIDPTEHEDGQKVSVQIDTQVGNPTLILPEFVQSINNSNPEAQYEIQAEMLFDKGDFWEFANKFSGQVTSVTFEFATPNGPWSTADEVKNAMKEYQRELNASKVVQTFQNKDGLDLNNEVIRASVDYAASGQGKIKAKSKNNSKYNSTDARKITTISHDEIGEMKVIDLVKLLAKKVLGQDT